MKTLDFDNYLRDFGYDERKTMKIQFNLEGQQNDRF